MLNDLFSGCFKGKSNYLTEVDARIKIFLIALALIITIISSQPYTPLIIVLLFLIFLKRTKIPFKIIFLKLAAPVAIAAMVFFLQIFFYGKIPLFKWNLFGLRLVVYQEGLWRGFLILTKVITATSLVIFLSMTTSLNKLLGAAYWLKLPAVWIEIATLTYRYIFVLLEVAITVKNAQKVRLGYSSPKKTLRSIGELAGTVIIRAFDQSLATYEAMRLRGYKENITAIIYPEKIKNKDILTGLIFIAFLSLLTALNILL